MFGAIPSPSSGVWHVFGLPLRAYGFLIALGVLAAVWLAARRAPERDIDPDAVQHVAFWAVIAGLVGARAYHVITDWSSFEGRRLDFWKVQQGGLGIPGGLIAGIAAGVWIGRKRGLNGADLVDICIPGIALAQAIGRWGNWFNQELFGKPTSLPWGLEIDVAHRPAAYLDRTTFHPTFLYESLWNLALVGVLIAIDRRRVLRRGHLIGVYLVGYGVGRLWIELLRIDPATHVLGMRVNVWMSLAAIAAGAATLVTGPVRAAEMAPAHLEAPGGGAAPIDSADDADVDEHELADDAEPFRRD